jgi:N-acetylmuramic acid 6-phosphate (MurNAc-6-P) etherase
VKLAILMVLTGLDATSGTAALAKTDGFLRKALEEASQ